MTRHKARYAFHDERIPSLSDVGLLVRNSTDALIAKRRPQLLTSVRRLMKHCGVRADGVPFTAPILRGFFERMTPVATGLSKKSLQNDWSNLRFLLGHLDLGGLTQYRITLTGDHAMLLQRLTDRHERSGLSRFFRFTCARQISLAAIDDQVSESFRRALLDEGLIKRPEQSWRMMIQTWNRVAERWADLGLQPLTYPLDRRGWAFPWSAFPSSLIDDVERYFQLHSEAGDLFDPDAPDVILRPRTITTQRDWLRVLASAAVHSGVPAQELSALDRLVHPRTVEAALRWYVNDHGAKLTEYVKMLAVQAQTVARRYCRFDEADVAALGQLVGRLHRRRVKAGDDTTRLARLRQFETSTDVYRMLVLGDHVVRTVRGRKRPSRRDPVDIALALAHELLLATSFRCGNLAALDLERHFIRQDDDRCLIRIPGAEVKNGETLHKELPHHVVVLLDLYLAEYRPLLQSNPSSWLFPGRNGRHKRPHTLSVQYREFLRIWADIEGTPHLIRSFADMLYCDQHPEGGEVMRRQLGQRSPETRLKHYADPRSRAANRAYVQLLIEERGKALNTIGLFR
jgi:Phage integrase family